MSVEHNGSITVATILDRSPWCDDVQALRQELDRLLNDPDFKYVALDFKNVDFFEADLRGQLVWLHRQLTSRGGRLAVCDLGMMKEHPTLVSFAEVMIITDSLDEALAALRTHVETEPNGSG